MKIGIIGAMNTEIEGIVKMLEQMTQKRIGSTDFFCGNLGGHDLVVARSGIGKVNSSMTTALLLSGFEGIDMVINTGVAGGIGKGIKQGDIVIASASVQHDFVNVPMGKIPEIEIVEFISDSGLIKLAEDVLKKQNAVYHKGIVVSGDEFISSYEKVEWLRNEFDAIACDMESASIAQVCYLMGKKFLSVRSVSDGGNDSAENDFNDFLEKAVKVSVRFIADFISVVA